MSRRAGAAIVVVVALAVGAGVAWWATSAGDEPAATEAAPEDGATDHRFVVPPGTHERIAAGEAVDILPRTLQAEVGDTIEIVNQDDTVAQVGVFVVGPGQTVRQRFTSEGTLEGICDVHPDGRFTIEVTA